MTDSFAKRLYVDNASTYQPILESGLKKAPSEVRGLTREFKAFRVPAPRKARVLDVSCGIGRHSINFAKRGYTVVGYDFSESFLVKARRLAKSMRLPRERLRFCRGDLADITRTLRRNRESGFDAIISMDYSIGYSGREADRRLFKNLLRLANHRCVLIVETGNRNFWLKHFQHYFRESFPGRLERITAFKLDKRRSVLRADMEMYRKLRDKSLKHLVSIRHSAHIYSKESLCQLLKSAGWRPVRAFENVQHPRKVTDQLPLLFMVATSR